MEVTILKKEADLTFDELEVGCYFILLEDNDLMVKVEDIEEGGTEVNAYSIKEDSFYVIPIEETVKRVKIKEIIVEEV